MFCSVSMGGGASVDVEVLDASKGEGPQDFVGVVAELSANVGSAQNTIAQTRTQRIMIVLAPQFYNEFQFCGFAGSQSSP